MAQDVMMDRNYLLALMQRNPRDPLRQVAEKQLEYLNAHEAQQAQLTASRENLAENIRARVGTETENRALREQSARQAENYRRDVLAQRESEASDRQAAQLLAALPEIGATYGKDAPAVSRKILDQFLAGRGITAPTAGVNETTKAAQRFLGKTPPTDEGVPSAATNVAPPAATGGTDVGGGSVEPQRTLRVPGGLTAREAMRSAPPGFMAVNAPDGGLVYVAQKPVSLVPTPVAEARPEGTVGMIGGRPAGDVLAEGALKTGTMPQSESGRTALSAKLSREGLPFFASSTETTPNPPTTAAVPVKPEPTGGFGDWLTGKASSTQVQAAQVPEGKFTFGDWLFGRTTPTGGAKSVAAGDKGPSWAPSSLASGPTPEPTPGAPLPTATPSPMPVAGATPPAVPTPTPGLDMTALEQARRALEEARRRPYG
jgi:hypothetical protein